MSIRNQKFTDEILSVWKEIIELNSQIDTKGLSTEEVEQIAHLKKVIAYFSEMIKGLDPDFIPLKVINGVINPLTSIKSSLNSYLSNHSISYIKNINDDYLDSLLKDLMPFIFYKGRAASALQSALNSYSEAVSEQSVQYLERIKSIFSEIEKNNNSADEILTKISEKQDKIHEYNNDLFESEGVKEQVDELISDFNIKNQVINDFYNKIFNDKNGIKNKITDYLSDGELQNKNLHSLKEDSEGLLDELKDFHTEIFGEEGKNGECEGGLKHELEIRIEELERFKIKQQEKYNELNSQIESLLPGATSAGLSSAYNEMHRKFNKDVEGYGKYFYWALGLLLFIVGLVNFLPNSTSYTEYAINTNQVKYISKDEKEINNDSALKSTQENNNHTDNNEEIFLVNKEISLSNKIFVLLDKFIYKLPFILPAIWLVLFISRRRNEAQRLAQEYAHKEALAKSYESYKKQIEKLSDEEQNKLLPILMENMLKAIALNPAETLDKNNKESTPIEEVINKKEFWEFVEKVKNIIPVKKD